MLALCFLTGWDLNGCPSPNCKTPIVLTAPIHHIPTGLQTIVPSWNAAVPFLYYRIWEKEKNEKKKHKKNPEKNNNKKQKKAGCHRKRSSPKAVRVKVAENCFHSKLVPGREVRAARFLRGGRVLAENTYWAEPTLLSLFPSTLAGFVSSTSCCSSVIGAAAGGHLQTSARLPSAPARPPPSGCHRPGRRPSEPRGASRPGQGRGPPTWTRSSDRDWSERAWKNPRGRGGEGRVEAKWQPLSPTQEAEEEKKETCWASLSGRGS